MKLKIGVFFLFYFGAVQNQKLLSTYDYNRYKYNSKKKQ